MSVDKLQKKIRKLKNPSVIDLTINAESIPPCLKEREASDLKAYSVFCKELLESLRGIVPAVRFGLGAFAQIGPEAIAVLQDMMQTAQQLDYYVLLDAPEALSARSAETAAQYLSDWPCDGFIISAYIGSDAIKAYLPSLEQKEKSLFVVLRTANRSASELQELMTGSRLVYMAAADIVSRLGEQLIGKCGYSQLAGVGAANASDSLRTLRSKYNRLFLLLDGYDYSNANAKCCSYAFDQFGHGAAACAADSVTAAWKQTPGDGSSFSTDAVEAAQRMQKNLLRYITVL